MARVLYHWTHRENLPSILATGLDPSYSEGKLARVWVCNSYRINWALWHVATRHGWDPDEMILLRVEVPDDWPVRTCNRNVYTVSDVIPPHRITGVRSDPLGSFDQTPAPAVDTRQACTPR